MTDSEDDELLSNIYSFPNDRTTIHAKGPNYENMSCRNNFLTSTMHASRYANFDRINLNYDQRSLYHKRDTSPISLRSVPDFRPRTFRHPYSMGAASYQQSIINGRSCSPTSVRSIDTNVSMSATDIALAIKSEAYNKHDLRLIKEALDKQLKMKLRRRVEKRRYHRLLKHMSKRNSGDDSGEHGSDSSINDDDCRSIRTAPHITNNSKYKTTLNLTNMKMTFNDANMYNDCTEDMRRKSLKNIICSDGPPAEIQNSNKTKKIVKSNSGNGVLLRDRFKNGLLLPSQRFKDTLISSNLSRVNNNNVHPNQIFNAEHRVDINEIPKNNSSGDMESEQEEIFSEITAIERNSQIVNNSHKRIIDLDELHCNPQKKSKVSSTQSQKSCNEVNCMQNNIASDFIFAKPQMPIRKSGNKKKELHSPEILLAKSRQPLFDIVEQTNTILPPVKEVQQKSSKQLDDVEEVEKKKRDEESVKHLSYDSSMQPSFIKRKLFTQKLEMAEKKNISDSSLSSSPHVKNINGNKERTKARKIASSQSCLSRDVLEEDNNFLHLLHKIVPADQINVTNASNKNTSNRNSQRESNDKWDVTSVISSCCQNDISDTYTDDEIFKVDDTRENKSKFKTNTKTPSITNCKVMLQKLPPGQQTKIATNIAQKQATVKKAKESNKENTNVRLNAYWDTDTESELEIYESSCNLNDSQINNKVDKSINSNKNCKKLQSHKAECTPVEATKTLGVKNKSQKGTNIKNTNGAGIKKSTKSDKRNIPLESKENNNNLLNISLSSNKNIQEINKPTETSKTVMLISHRMGRPTRQVKSKKMNVIESPSPKDSDISIKEKEKPTETYKATAIIGHRIARSKSQVRSNKTNPVESRSSTDTSNSNTELNISIKSLRSYNKNEKVARNLRSRNRSGVKGI